MKAIAVTEELPVHDQEVLAFFPKLLGGESRWMKARFSRDDKRTKGYFDTAEFEDNPMILQPGKHITHWMKMPAAPKGY